MKKNISIIGNNIKDSKDIQKLLQNIFENSIYTKIYTADALLASDFDMEADLFLITPVTGLFLEISAKKSINKRVLPINKTISQKGADILKKFNFDRAVYLKDENLETEINIINNIYQTGITHLNILPYSQKDINKESRIILMEEESDNLSDENILKVGKSVIDISNIIDISFILEIDDKISNKNLLSCYKGYAPASTSVGMTKLMEKFNKIDGQHEILMSCIDYGIISVDNYGLINLYNRQAEIICGVEGSRMKNTNIADIFPLIPYKKAMQEKEAVVDNLIKLNEYDVIVSVQPVMHSSNLYGAVIILKRFNEIEKKQHAIRAQLFGKGHVAKYYFNDIIGDGVKINELKNVAKRMAKSNSTILITGESGTGKELFAQAVHNFSNRKNHQFVAVNCGSLPENLLESELFGYEEGAFTGAKKGGKIGLFELAHNGTIFLDEIGNMPLNLQNRLLRVLQERQVMRIGADRLINVDVRLIAATNSDLKELISKGQFRKDLYFRINVLPLYIPPLRERTEDIDAIISAEKKRRGLSFEFTPDAHDELMRYSWEGNVRELINLVEYIANLDKRIIQAEDLKVLLGHDIVSYGIPEGNYTFLNRKDCGKYLFILNQLKLVYQKRQRLGRRSLYSISAENGLMLGEQKIRSILLELEENSLVTISKGRGGTSITEDGLRFINNKGNNGI